MTSSICEIFSVLIFAGIILFSRETLGISQFSIRRSLSAIAILLIIVALNTRGIWYSSDLYLGDIWTVQDALHKTAEGYRSSLDYFNPIGPIFEWVLRITLIFQSPSSSSLVIANVVVASLALILTHVLLRHRASGLTVAVVGIIAVTTALSPRDIDALISTPQHSLLAPYNRWGWALLAPVAMWSALPAARFNTFGAIFAGFAITALLLLKITYGLAALGILIVVLTLYPLRWRETLIVLASVLIGILVLNYVSGGQIFAYFGDLALSSRLPGNRIRLPKLLVEIPALSAYALGCLLLVSAIARQNPSQGTQTPWSINWRPYLVALAVGGSGTVILMQNHYTTEAVTLLLMPLIIAEHGGLLADASVHSFACRRRNGEFIGAILLVTLATPAVDAGFIAAQKIQTLRYMFLAKPLAGTEFDRLSVDEVYQPLPRDACNSRTCNDVRRMFSGRELIERHCPLYRAEAILAFNFSNPFPALLGTRSPKHAPIWLDADRSFSRAVHVAPEQLFSGVGCVIVAKNDIVATAMSDIYGAELRRLFRFSAEDEYWSVWTRSTENQN